MAQEAAKRARRSIRLKEYDYAQRARYFVTICTCDGACVLGSIHDEIVEPSRFGLMVERCWLDIPTHFPAVELGGYVIMPNHLHGVIGILDTTPLPGRGEAFALHRSAPSSKIADVEEHREVDVYNANASPLQQPPSTDDPRPKGTKPGSLAAIVQNFKAITTRRANNMMRTPGSVLWQRNYYEHVIRSDKSLAAIEEYIRQNPANWPKDEYYGEG